MSEQAGTSFSYKSLHITNYSPKKQSLLFVKIPALNWTMMGETKGLSAVTKHAPSFLSKVYFRSLMCSVSSLFLDVSNHRFIYPSVTAKRMTQAAHSLSIISISWAKLIISRFFAFLILPSLSWGLLLSGWHEAWQWWGWNDIKP